MKDERVSSRIHFPRYSYRISHRMDGITGYHDVLGRAVLISIINYLAEVADAVEKVKLPTRHEDRARLKVERRKMCDSVVKGANDLTAIFDSAKGESKYTDLAPKNLPRYRNDICGQVLNPLQKADARRTTFGRPFSFTPYREKLSAILSGTEKELRRWLRVPRDESRRCKHGNRRSRHRRSASPSPLRSLCTVM